MVLYNREMNMVLAKELDDVTATQLLRGITIPPQPTVLQAVMREQQRPEPDMQKLGNIIAKDISLSAAMLRAANSPAFGLRQKVTSISRAVLLLGMRNTASLVTGLILRQVITGTGKINLEIFWDNAADAALVCSFLAKRLKCMSADYAHLIGLFHDCGIPLMMLRFHNYTNILGITSSLSQEVSVSLEEQHFNTNHATVGYIMARSWCLPDEVRRIISHHHDTNIFTQAEDTTLARQVAMLTLAEHFCCLFRKEDDSAVWTQMDETALIEVLGVTADELAELRADAFDLLSTSVT